MSPATTTGSATDRHGWRQNQPRHGPGPYAVVDGRVCTDGLEVIVTHHCNLRCRGCAYLAPSFPSTVADPEWLGEVLTTLARSFHASEARVLGGEPLLHPDLPAVLAAVRASGVCDTIRVITNGLRLPRARSTFWEAVDEVSVSTYPGRELPNDAVTAVESAAQAHGVRLKFKRFDSFREPYSEVGTNDGLLVGRIFRTCQMANVWRCITIWDGRLYRCPQSLFLPNALDGLGDAREGLAITNEPGFVDGLLEFLESPEPLRSCRHCLGSVGRLFENVQIRRGVWRDAQRPPTEDLVDWPHLDRLEANPGMLIRDTSYLSTGP